ncbi:MAG: flotillin family protein [Phycisphaerae bacterium]|nr:flotillin family protein [Phycisphaerae bacterium]
MKTRVGTVIGLAACAALGVAAIAFGQRDGGGGGLLEPRATQSLLWLGVVVAVLFVLVVVALLVFRYYRRCPSNRILVIYGRVSGGKAAKCMHGGGTVVWPLIQDWAYLSLEPMVIDIPLSGALSLNNIRVNVPATFTVGISTDPVLMNNAAERLLNLTTQQIRDQAQDIILGQLRLVIATLTIEEINKDREKFMKLINENVAQEINKIGLELINVNVRDITDESGYIEAIGKRAAAEAINRAKVEVAQQEREGATGEALAVREREVSVAAEIARSEQGKKEADASRRAAIAALEAQAITAEAAAQRDREVTVAQRASETLAAKKMAEQEQRVRVAESEAQAVTGENTSRAKIARTAAELGEVEAESRRRKEVAAAKAAEAILLAQRDQEVARMAKETIAPQEIEAKRITVAAEAEAEKRRIEARGEADAITAKYQAEAEGVRLVLEAKAEGYRKLIESCGQDSQVGPTLLLIEQLPKLVAEQVKAISNLKIDKITVWDTGVDGNGRNATSNFLAGIVNSLPRLHELARQAGVELPAALGTLSKDDRTPPPPTSPAT